MPEQFATMLDVDAARARIVEICTARRLPIETVALENAAGRVLADSARAPFDIPGFTNSAMDGFAVRGEDLPGTGEKMFRLIGEVLAGGVVAPEVMVGECVLITTGAPMPRGADTVVMKEDARVDGDAIMIASGTAKGANVRPAGEDYRAGDDGIDAGSRLTPARLGVLASFGAADVRVRVRPRAILLTTGDELVAPGHALGFGQIHDSNRHSLGALLVEHGVELVRHERLRDNPELLRDALLRAAKDADIVVSSGGVSAGEADYLPRLIGEIGKVHFWKVRIKPGMPFLFGEIGRALMFALPGNPVSGIAIFLTMLRPALDALGGTVGSGFLRARLGASIDKRHSRTEFQRARLECDERGQLHAIALAHQGSGMLRGVAQADALIMLPPAARMIPASETVEVLPLPGWPGA